MTIITKKNASEITEEQVLNLPLDVLGLYASKMKAGIFVRVAEKAGIGKSYVSEIIAGKKKAIFFRPLIENWLREEVQHYLKELKKTKESSKDS